MLFSTPAATISYTYTLIAGTRPVLYLHSALGSSEEMKRFSERFPDRPAIFLDFPGHGTSEAVTGPSTIQTLADAALHVLQTFAEQTDRSHTSVDIIGYSLGGYVALQLASTHPEWVRSVTSHAMKFYWTPEAIERALQAFGLAKAPASAIEVTASVIRDFLRRQLTTKEILAANVPVLLTTGDLDDFVTPNEVSILAGELNASIAILGGTKHSLRTFNGEQFEREVRAFWNALNE